MIHEKSSALLNRRGFIKTTVALTSVAAIGSALAAPRPGATKEIIDVNVNLARWPLRRLRFDDTAALVSIWCFFAAVLSLLIYVHLRFRPLGGFPGPIPGPTQPARAG